MPNPDASSKVQVVKCDLESLVTASRDAVQGLADFRNALEGLNDALLVARKNSGNAMYREFLAAAHRQVNAYALKMPNSLDLALLHDSIVGLQATVSASLKDPIR